DPVPRTQSAMVEWLHGAMVRTGESGGDVPLSGAPVTTTEVLADQLAGEGPPILFVIDDAHLLEGSEAEQVLVNLMTKPPPRLRLVVASRVHIEVDLSRMRVSGELVDIGPDDLRFRTWEVEELFRDVYREPLLPEDV